MRLVTTLLLGLLVLAPLHAQQGDRPGEVQAPVPDHIEIPPSPILSPEEAMETFTVAPGFRIELVAAEPLVHEPIVVTFAPDGRMWVVELRGFMPNVEGIAEEAPIGTIAILEDTDGDGKMDKRTVFAENLVLPRALALVADGALVGEPPQLWFMRDTNGDSVADEKVEISRYGSRTNVEHSENGLYRALDNWMYNAKSSVRFRHVGGTEFIRDETIARGQWGITQDNVGRIYYNTNSDPLRVDVVPSEYFERNPNLTNPEGINVGVVPSRLQIWPGRVTPGVNRGYQILNEEGKLTSMTAASAPTIYRDSLFPSDHLGNGYVPEPSGNLVKRIIIDETGGTLVGRNAYEGSEFLTSTDERFRPVFLSNGPDGALYIADMYRGILQHRIFVTTFLRQQILDRGLDRGLGLGRIYRIVPDNKRINRPAFDLSKDSSVALVDHLRSADSWWRDTAQRLLVERRDPASVQPLRALARSGDAPALARLHALWTLHGIEQLDRATVLAAMDGTDEHVTAAAIRLSEPWLAQSEDVEVFQRVTTVMKDQAGNAPPTIVLQRALSLGEARSPAAFDLMMEMASKYNEQPFVPDAIVSGLAGRELEFIRRITAGPSTENAHNAVRLATSAVLRSGESGSIASLLALLEPGTHLRPWARTPLLEGFREFLPRRAPRGRPVSAEIPVEPTSLLALAKRTGTPEGDAAAEIVASLNWPGKPGQEAPTVALVLTPEQRALMEQGREQYAALCAACHGPAGEGLPALGAPLRYSRYALGSEEALARIILNGKQGDPLAMPPLNSLSDEAIAGVLTYIRQSWGHNETPVAPATISRIRQEVATREQPWRDEELSRYLTN